MPGQARELHHPWNPPPPNEEEHGNTLGTETDTPGTEANTQAGHAQTLTFLTHLLNGTQPPHTVPATMSCIMSTFVLTGRASHAQQACFGAAPPGTQRSVPLNQDTALRSTLLLRPTRFFLCFYKRYKQNMYYSTHSKDSYK